jgi:hypothetical protein
MRHAHFRILAVFVAVAAGLGLATPALAYVGPGAGLTLLGALWGLIAAVVMTVGFIVLWPFRRLLLARRQKAGDAADTNARDQDDVGDTTMLTNRRDRDEP